VDTVGEENDHLRLAWRVTKTVGCRRDRVADRRSILQLPRLKIRDRLLDHCVISGQGYLAQRFAGECDDTDPVGSASGDELLHRRLGNFNPVVRTEIEGQHRAGQIDRQNDVDSFARLSFSMCSRPRARECKDEKREREISEREYRRRYPAADARTCGQGRRPRKHDRVLSAKTSPQPPRWKQEQKPERLRCEELEQAEDLHAALPLAAACRFAGSDSGFTRASTLST